jgi:hypothetical protein
MEFAVASPTRLEGLEGLSRLPTIAPAFKFGAFWNICLAR